MNFRKWKNEIRSDTGYDLISRHVRFRVWRLHFHGYVSHWVSNVSTRRSWEIHQTWKWVIG